MHPLCTITNEHTAVTYKAFSANQHLHNDVKHNYSVFKMAYFTFCMTLCMVILIYRLLLVNTVTLSFVSLLLLLPRFKTFLIYII